MVRRLLLAFIAVVFVVCISRIDNTSTGERSEIVREYINEAIVTCYAIDGVYPATFDDLQSRSGIAVDPDRFTVIYEIFASNIYPTVTVFEVER